MVNPGLGTLSQLPREIRDEVFRYTIEGRYLFNQPSTHPYEAMTARKTRKQLVRNFRFAIFQVSKAMHNEATSIFYSESVFRDFVDMPSYLAFLPAQMTDRMMKIELVFDFHDLHGEWTDLGPYAIEDALTATLERFTGLGSLRKTLLLEFELFGHDIRELLSDHLFGRLKALVGFRTVIVGSSPRSFLSSKTGHRAKFEGIAQVIEKELVPTMGPATVNYGNLNTYLEFHPLEHMRANLGAQMEKMQMEMDKLQSGETD